MNSFGLGLVLNFVDNASSGMNTATNNFMRMSATADSLTSSVSASAAELASIAFSLGAVGDTFVSIGESITGVFAGITQQVIDTGMEMQGYRMQLSALYGSVEAGEAKIEEIKQYAMSSVFDIQSLIPAVTMMKAVGIEAMSEVTTSSGNATQKLLDYASDIAAMVPNMRNTYGTGVKAAMGAIKEYIAEGNALTLKRSAGLDIKGILGEGKGASIEERTQQVADLVEKLNIVGYTANLAGTPTQRLSNMQDALFNSLSKIADSGVFEVYCGLLEKLSNWVFSLVENEETFNTITGVLADTITSILSPLESMLDWVIENSNAIIEWVQAHPKLTKNILVTVAAIGAFLVVGGSLLKLLSSIAFATMGLSMLKSLPALLSKVGIAFTSLIGKALPFVALAAVAYFAWKNNLFGIRDVATGVMNDLGAIISIVSDAWNDNTLSEENFIKAKELGILPLVEALLQLKYYWDFFKEGFSAGFKGFFDGIAKSLEGLKLMGIDVNGLAASVGEFLKSLTEVGAEDKWRAIGEVIGQLTASLVTLIVVANAFKGVYKVVVGVGKAFSIVGKAAKGLWSILKWLFNPIIKVAPVVIAFFKDMGAAISLMREGFGFFEVMGAWFPKLAAFFTKIGGGFVKVFGWVAKLAPAFSKLGGWLLSAGKAIGAFFSSIGSAIMSALTAIASALGISVGWVVAIIAAIVAVIALVITFRKEIGQFFVWLWGKIKEFCSWLGERVADIFKAVKQVVSDIVQAILNNPIVQSVIKVAQSIFNCIVTVGQTIWAFIKGVATTIWNIIKLVGTIVAGVAKVIWSVISGVAGVIWTCIKGLVNFIVACAQGIWSVIKKVVNLVWTIIKTAANIIKSIINVVYQFFRVIFLAIVAVVKIVINAIVSAFQWLWSKIQPVLQAIGDFFSFIFNWVKDNVVMPVVNWITTAFTTVRDWIVGCLQTIGDFFSSIFTWINKNVLTPFRDFIIGVFDWINEKITAVTNWFSEAFTAAADAITGVFEGIKEFFAGVWESITGGAKSFFNWIGDKLSWLIDAISSIGDFFSNGINAAGDWLSGVGDSIANFIGLDTGGYVKTTGLAVLHPNEVVVNDDTTKRLQNFLGKYDSDTINGVSRDITQPQAVLNNIYPTVMEAVPVAPVPAETVASVNNNSSFVTNTQNFVQTSPAPQIVEKTGETKNDYSVTFAAGSIVIQLANTSDSELEKAAEKIMKIIARKQQLRAMAVRA